MITVDGAAEPAVHDLAREASTELDRLSDRIAVLEAGYSLTIYTVATLPTIGAHFPLIWVSDETGGAISAVDNGTNWCRTSDGATVS